MLKLERDKDGAVAIYLRMRLPRMPMTWKAPWQGRDLSPLALLLIPIIAILGDRSLLFNFPGYLDSWIYYAFYRHPAGLYHLFPSTYYGSRLSVILPGYIVNKLLPPLAANDSLHVLVWFGAVISMYVIVKNLADRRAALITATAFGFYPYLWKATGWDYPDGIADAYYLITMALLTLASERPSPPRRHLFLAGICLAGAVYSNLTWIFLAPCFAFYWLFLRKARALPLALFRAAAWLAAGAFALSLALSLINHHWAGFYFFYYPSIDFALHFVKGPSPYKAKDGTWIWRAPWLYLPAATVAAGLLASARVRWRQGDLESRMLVALYVNLLYCAGMLTAWELAGSPLLEIFYYASYLMPAVFLFLGLATFSVPKRLSRWEFYGLVGGAAVAFSLVWWDRQGVAWNWMFSHGPAVPIGVACAVMIAAAGFRGRTAAVVLSLLGVWVLSLNSRVMPGIWGPPDATQNAFLRIVRAMDICDKDRNGEAIRFWYDAKDPNGQEFASIASGYLYGYSLLALDFPSLPNSVPESMVAILSSRADPAREARESLKSHEFRGDIVSNHVIEGAGVSYSLTLMRVEDDVDVTQSAGYVRNGSFESGIAPWAGGWATLRDADGGQSGKCLELLAQKGPSQYAMSPNLKRLETGSHYKFSFWVKSGSSGDELFVVGLWDAQSGRWAASRSGRSSAKWTPYELEFTNTSTDRLSVEIMKNSPTIGSMLFDSVQLVPLR